MNIHESVSYNKKLLVAEDHAMLEIRHKALPFKPYLWTLGAQKTRHHATKSRAKKFDFDASLSLSVCLFGLFIAGMTNNYLPWILGLNLTWPVVLLLHAQYHDDIIMLTSLCKSIKQILHKAIRQLGLETYLPNTDKPEDNNTYKLHNEKFAGYLLVIAVYLFVVSLLPFHVSMVYCSCLTLVHISSVRLCPKPPSNIPDSTIIQPSPWLGQTILTMTLNILLLSAMVLQLYYPFIGHHGILTMLIITALDIATTMMHAKIGSQQPSLASTAHLQQTESSTMLPKAKPVTSSFGSQPCPKSSKDVKLDKALAI